MRKPPVYLLLLISLTFVTIVAAAAGEKHYILSGGERDFYFAHISYLPADLGSKNPEVLRSGIAGAEEVQLNLPLVPGDVLVTYDRPCEVQFDSGTIVRLDVDSRLKIETVLAQTLSSEEKLSSLFLEKGRLYLMYTAYNSWEIFQLVTPAAALKMKNHTVLVVAQDEPGPTKIAVLQGSAKVLFGPDEKNLRTQALKKGQNLIISGASQTEKVSVISEFGEFVAWNEKINREFVELHKGLTPLPKPVQKLPSAVFYFAQYYGNKYGEWLWDDLYGYVWRPFYNDIYPWGNWSPYFYGRWSYVNGELFWVPEEPWGWVPYHLGIWQWDKKLGWVWIPGSVFAPAWVDWCFYYGYFSWRPWTLSDFLFYAYYGLGTGDYYWNNYWTGWSTGSYFAGNQMNNFLKKVSKDQLKKRSSVIPSEFRQVLNTMAQAVEKNDRTVLERIEGKSPAVIIRREDIARTDLRSRMITSPDKIQEQLKNQPSAPSAVKEIAGTGSAKNPAEEFLKWRQAQAVSENNAGEAVRRVVAVMDRKQVQSQRSAANFPSPRNNPAEYLNAPEARRAENARKAGGPVFNQRLRFRDWNPDVRVAREAGFSLVYDSSRNAIVVPELGVSSREAKEWRVRLTPSGLIQHVPSGWADNSSSYISSDSSSPVPTVSPKTMSSGSSNSGHSSGGNSSNAGREKH
ncbi:MAG: DUF6600 domain-containing protein [Candidatus Saccharicenans sp.]